MTNATTNIALWALQILTAAAFLASGGAKLAVAGRMVETFDKIGRGQWFRYLTGFLQVAGAIALLVPGYAFYGAALLAVVMAGAVASHLLILGGSFAPALVLLIFSAVIAYFRR